MIVLKMNMPKWFANLSAVIVVALLLTTISAAKNDPEVKQQAMALKGQAFVIRTADDLVGGEATVSLDEDNRVSLSLNGNSEVDWQGRYFMSGTRYVRRVATKV